MEPKGQKIKGQRSRTAAGYAVAVGYTKLPITDARFFSFIFHFIKIVLKQQIKRCWVYSHYSNKEKTEKIK